MTSCVTFGELCKLARKKHDGYFCFFKSHYKYFMERVSYLLSFEGSEEAFVSFFPHHVCPVSEVADVLQICISSKQELVFFSFHLAPCLCFKCHYCSCLVLALAVK